MEEMLALNPTLSPEERGRLRHSSLQYVAAGVTL
jgi:hypothetical protein